MVKTTTKAALAAKTEEPTVDQPFRAMGKDWTLAIDVSAICDIETDLDTDLMGIRDMMSRASIRLIRQFVAIGLRKHHRDEATLELAGEILGEVGFEEMGGRVRDSLQATMSMMFPAKAA